MEALGAAGFVCSVFSRLYAFVWIVQVIPFDIGERLGEYIRERQYLMSYLRPVAQRLAAHLYVHPDFAKLGAAVLRRHQALNDYLDEALQD